MEYTFLHALFFQKDYNCMAELKNIRIAVSGIYDYALEEIPTLRLPLPGQGAPDWAEKKQIYKIYRPAFVLAAACDKFKMLPLTHHHPQTPVDGQNFRKLAVGYTGENPFIDWIKDTDEVGIRSTVMIYDDEALNAYERGEIQLSPGYVASFEWQKGKAPDGQEYDIVMKEITDVNHLALLPAGRGGEYAVVMDGARREPSVFELAKLNLAAETRDSRRIYQIGEISEKTGLQKTATGWRRPTKKADTEESRKDYKKAQLKVILKTNRMNDDYHVGIRKVEDIKTFEEAMQDDESFYWGDFEREDAEEALRKGSITVYSSKPIVQGGFVSTSMNQAKDYAGGGKVYSKEIPLKDVAWINGDEGQYTGNLDTKDGAPKGNDNASKDHVKKEDVGLDEKEKAHLHDLLKTNAVEFPTVEFTEENYKKYLGSPIDTPMGKVKLGENQFEKLKSKNRQNLIGAIHDTLEKPCFIAEEKGGTTLYVKSFIQNDKQKNIMSVVIKRDGLNISISTHEEREPQILSKIKKAGVLRETASDDGTVHDERVADTTRVVSLNITDTAPEVKSVFEIAAGSVFDRARR